MGKFAYLYFVKKLIKNKKQGNLIFIRFPCFEISAEDGT